jgi:hypothetical protein
MSANFSGLLLAAQASQQRDSGEVTKRAHDEEENRLAKKFRSTPRTEEERKSRHRAVERRRTRNTNKLINQLREEVKAAGRTIDNNKAAILAASINLIRDLSAEIRELKAGGAVATAGGFSGHSSTSVSGDDSDHAAGRRGEFHPRSLHRAAFVASASDAGVARPAVTNSAGDAAAKARSQQLRQVHQMLQYQQLQQQQMQQMQQMAIWRSQQLQMQQMQQMQQGVLAQGAGLPQVYPQGAWPAAALAQQQQQLQRRVVAATAAKTAGTPPPPPSPPIFPTAMGAKSAV